MGIYEIVASVEESVAGDYEAFVETGFLPALLGTGCFDRVEFAPVAGNRYVLRLFPKSDAELERYLREHATRLRDQFLEHLPSGVRIVRGSRPPVHAIGAERSAGVDVRLNRLRHATDL